MDSKNVSNQQKEMGNKQKIKIEEQPAQCSQKQDQLEQTDEADKTDHKYQATNKKGREAMEITTGHQATDHTYGRQAIETNVQMNIAINQSTNFNRSFAKRKIDSVEMDHSYPSSSKRVPIAQNLDVQMESKKEVDELDSKSDKEFPMDLIESRENAKLKKRGQRVHETEEQKEARKDKNAWKNRKNYQSNLDKSRKQERTKKQSQRAKNKEKVGKLYRKARKPLKDIEFYRLSEFNVRCIHCGALHFQEERPTNSKYPKDSLEDSFGDCCNYGKIAKEMKQTVKEYPEELKELFSPEYEHHKHFIKNIRKYNSAFSCASLSCTRVDFYDTNGPPCFKIQGQVYHKFNPNAQPVQGVPTNGQIYYLDTQESREALDKQEVANDCEKEVLDLLHSYLHENYIYAKSYRMMKDVYEEEEAKAKLKGNPIPEVKMIFNIRNNLDKNRYNVPQANEVCAVFVCDSNGDVPPSSMVVYRIGDKDLTNIKPFDPNVVPMTYPILYPTNSQGWKIDMMYDDGRRKKRISLCDFNKFHLFYRDNGTFIPHFYASKLFQQYVVDQAAKIEWDRLCYIRNHQHEIGRDGYVHLKEVLEKRANEYNVKLEPHIILPSSFSQGPRNLHESFMDAMTIVQETGKPDVFLTYTCNPNDPDIQKALIKENAQTASDRPDIVARVFKLKRDKLLEEIFVDHIFGKTTGYVWVIEYQKRGLPHMHLLFSLRSEDKLHTADEIDGMISCEIPLQEEDPVLYEIVTKNMIHGPCGENYPKKICWNKEKKRCDKRYPRPYKEKTELNDDGYPFYKRPNNGRFFEKFINKKKVFLTNENVVPYNIYLLKRFQAHINVEKVADVKAIKYIYKYIYKGYDAAVVECLQKGHQTLKYDETKDYLEARYLSPCEACWRIFKFSFQSKSHHVEKLTVHLEKEQNVYYNPKASDDEIKAAMEKDTTLTAYFKFHDAFPEHRNEDGSMFLYTQMPKKCTWIPKTRKWKPRQAKFKALGRMYPVNPTDTEKYYLRYLLLHVPAKSFTDLKTHNGIEHETYAKAALARGLAENDDEWKCCLNEAKNFKMPNKLRTLFVNILLHCAPKKPEELWELFKDELAMDLRKKLASTLPDEVIYQKTLYLIDKQLKNQEKSLKDFKALPQINKAIANFDEEDFVQPELEETEAMKLVEKMNSGQLKIFNKVKSSLEDNSQQLLFIDGPGGTGKSFTLNAIYHIARSQNKIVCNTAFSGIAATVLKKGRTLHNRFGLPLNVSRNSKSRISNTGFEAEELRNTDFFIWDEAPMASKFVLNLIDEKLKELMKNDKPFGGKSMILSGDFRQCLPILEFANRTEIVDLLIRNSPLWNLFESMHLTENMRAEKDAKKFAEEVMKIGNGNKDGNDEYYVKLPDCCYTDEDLVKEIYSDVIENGNYNAMSERAILSPFNAIVDQYNQQIMDQFPGEYKSYLSADKAETNTPFSASPEVLNNIKNPGLPDHELKLKINCIVRLVRNLNVKEGLCNGTRMRVIGMGVNMLQCEIITGDRKGQMEFIPRITLIQNENVTFPFSRHQFPIKPAFAFTINKSQSQTFERIGIDYRQEPFSHGHTYVALSRVKSWKGIKIKTGSNKMVKNIVYQEVLM